MEKAVKKQPSDKDRIRTVTKNFFMHYHAPKIHVYSLKPSFTLGLGIINISLFIILLISGILLMVYYKPSITSAYDSILDINNIVIGGKYIRNIHRWAAHGLVFLAMIHMSPVFFTAAYRGEQRVTWNLGVGLLIVTLFSSFSGYLLPWDQLGFWAVTIASNIVSSTRELTDAIGVTAIFNPGLVIKKLLLGGTELDQDSLTRFYLLHIVVLPLLFILLSALHFWRIRKNGGLNLPANADDLIGKKMSDQSEIPNPSRTVRELFSWPVAFWAELSILLLTLVTLSTFALFIDAPLKDIANPALPENPAKAPWYFLGIQELVSYSAFGGGVLLPLLVIFVLFWIPKWDKETKNTGIWFSGKTGFEIVKYSGLLTISIITMLMTIILRWGWIIDWFPSVPPWITIILNPGIISGGIFIIFAIIIYRRTHSSRLGIISMYSCILFSYAIFTAIGIWFRVQNWEFSLWPF